VRPELSGRKTGRTWQADPVPRFTRAELESFRGVEVPDLVGPGLRLVFVGINPGLRTAATQIHFGNPANRFRPALVGAGILPPPADGVPGMTDAELVEGAARLEVFAAERRPRVVAVLGVTAYRTAFRQPRATLGRQPDGLGGAALWVLPNPSGLNAHETVASLAAAYAEPARAAGVLAVGAG
jgi:TDG/mug DNA glycosylase family protein